MTYGYGDSTGGWPEPDPARSGRREPDDAPDDGWPTGRRPEHPGDGTDQSWSPPPGRGYAAPPDRRYGPPSEPQRAYAADEPDRGYGPASGPTQGYGPTNEPPRAYGPTNEPQRPYGPNEPQRSYGPAGEAERGYRPVDEPPRGYGSAGEPRAGDDRGYGAAREAGRGFRGGFQEPPTDRGFRVAGYGEPPAEDSFRPGGYGAPPAGGDLRPGDQPEPPTDRAYPPPPAERGSVGRAAPPPRRPGSPEPAWDAETTGYARRPEGPGVQREPQRESQWGEARSTGRPPQAWQTDLYGDRPRYDDAPRGGPADPRASRGSVYGAGTATEPYPPADPYTRPAGPPRPRSAGERPAEDWADQGAPRRRSPWVPALAVLAAVALLAVCGVGFYVTFLGGRPGPDGRSGPTVHDISSQTVDPAPLTVAEVFPAATITVTGDGKASAPAANPSGSAAPAGVQPYTVVKSEAAECKTAAVGDLTTLLANAGCSQVVRATLTTADGQYVVTTGLFNLRDATTAKQTGDSVKGVVDTTKGRFTGFMAGGATDIIGRAKTQLAWDTRGHFLLYCVIARADGADPDARNPAVTGIVADLVESFLNETVLTNRTLTPPPVPSGSGAAPTSPAK